MYNFRYNTYDQSKTNAKETVQAYNENGKKLFSEILENN